MNIWSWIGVEWEFKIGLEGSTPGRRKRIGIRTALLIGTVLPATQVIRAGDDRDSCPADIDCDFVVDAADLGLMLAA